MRKSDTDFRSLEGTEKKTDDQQPISEDEDMEKRKKEGIKRFRKSWIFSISNRRNKDYSLHGRLSCSKHEKEEDRILWKRNIIFLRHVYQFEYFQTIRLNGSSRFDSEPENLHRSDKSIIVSEVTVRSPFITYSSQNPWNFLDMEVIMIKEDDKCLSPFQLKSIRVTFLQ